MVEARNRMIENVSCLFFILCHKEVAIVIHATEMKSKKKNTL